MFARAGNMSLGVVRFQQKMFSGVLPKAQVWYWYPCSCGVPCIHPVWDGAVRGGCSHAW